MKKNTPGFAINLLLKLLKVTVFFLFSYFIFLLIFIMNGSLHTLRLILPGYVSPALFIKFHILNITILSVEYLPVLLFISYYYWLMVSHKKVLTSFMVHRGVSPIRYFLLVILISSSFFFILSFVVRQNVIPVTGNTGYQNFKKSMFKEIIDNPQGYIGKDLGKLGPYYVSVDRIEKKDTGYTAHDIHILSSRNQGGLQEVDSVIQCSQIEFNKNTESIVVEDCSVFASSFQTLDISNYIRSAVYDVDDLFNTTNDEKNNITIVRLLPIYMAKYIDYKNLSQYFCTNPVFWSLDNKLFYLAFFLLGIAAFYLSYFFRNLSSFVQMLIIIVSAFTSISVADILQIYSGRIDSIFHLRYALPDLLAIFIGFVYIIMRYFKPFGERI
jgi:hypothetical protein